MITGQRLFESGNLHPFMSLKRKLFAISAMLLVGLVGLTPVAAPKKEMPRADVVEVPAIGQGMCVANLFQSNMVLQRDKPLNIWGWAEPGETVTVSFAGQEVQAKAAADRAWQVTLKPVPVNKTPQTMTVKGKGATLTLDNILVGDVWVMGGQSNMEFPIAKVDDGDLEIASANFPQIRLMLLPQGKGFNSVHSFERLHEWSGWFGQHFRKGDWMICTPDNVREFPAIGYIFGRRIHMASGVPIGLINTSIGGTTVETWTPEAVLRKIVGAETKTMLQEWDDKIAAFDPQADLKTRIANHENRIKNLKAKGQPVPADSKPPSEVVPGPAADRNRPGHCFAGVIKPLQGLATAGVVWHQGFNNCFNGTAGARMYYQVFAQKIAAWREAFSDPKLPYCIISLCTAGAPQTLEDFLPPMHDAGNHIREAHYQTFCDLRAAGDKTIGFASSFDLRKSWYHPQIKIPAGERAARWALTMRHGLLKGDENWLPPSVKKTEIQEGAMKLSFDTEVRTRDDSDGRILGFAIAGDDRRFYPADTDWFTDGDKNKKGKPEYDKTILVLRSKFVPEPKHFRYAWARNPLGNLVNGRGVSFPTQRSDDWIMEETPLPRTGTDQRANNRQVQQELKRADLERRLQEAEATIAELKPVLEKTAPPAKNK